MKTVFLQIMTLLITIVANAQWEQIGQNIVGESYQGRFGNSVSINADGSIIAAGAIYHGGDAGQVKVFQYNLGSWSQIGEDINGDAVGDQSGFSISLSSDGSTVAIGAPFNDDNVIQSGQVRVFRNISENWIQIGENIYGEVSHEYLGYSVSLSSDGNTLAVGIPNNDNEGVAAFSGSVKIYQNIYGVWEQIGSEIHGLSEFDKAGSSVSLNSDGSVVAIGSPERSNGSYNGQVRVFMNIGGVWEQVGEDINGETIFDKLGYSVSLSSDGLVIAIGGINSNGNGSCSGVTKVYKNNMGAWEKIGANIYGETEGDYSGCSVSLNFDGTVVAIGAENNDGNGIQAGHARVYRNTFGDWTQIGEDINGNAVGDQLGRSVSLSSDGSTVVVGAPQNDEGGANSGHVRVYGNTVGVNEIRTEIANIFPNPAIDYFTVLLYNNEESDLKVLDITGKVVCQEIFSKEINISTEKFKEGLYFVKVKNNDNIIIRKIIVE